MRIRPSTALVCALLASGGAAHAWDIWPSPFGGGERLDQHQDETADGSAVHVRPGAPVGQTFVPDRAFLARLDVAIGNQRDERPGWIGLWRWRGSRERTVASDPLWSDRVDLAGPPSFATRSFFPMLAVEPGRALYLELRADGRGSFRVKHSPVGGDAYPRGGVIGPPDRSYARFDLWFRTFDRGDPAGSPSIADDGYDAAPRWRRPKAPSSIAGRDAYLARVRAFAGHVRADAVRNCRQPDGGNALREALLYRISCADGACDETHARAARDMLRAVYSWRTCSHEVHPLGSRCARRCEASPKPWPGWMLEPALAALWLESSPSFGPDDRQRTRTLVAEAARRAFPEREHGAFNRAMQAAAAFALSARLSPDDPDAPRWRAYADEVWSAFWSVRDTREDSSSYTGAVFVPSLLLYADAAGRDEELWRDAGFRLFVDGLANTILPAGLPATFGDGVGASHEIGGLVWLFERAATRLHEPRYRWIARRLFDYHQRFVADAPPAAESLQKSITWLGLAWLDADPALAPVAPTALRDRRLVDPASVEPRSLDPGEEFVHEIALPLDAGPLAGLDVDLRTATATELRLELRRDDGTRVFSERRPIPAGAQRVEFRPLAPDGEGSSRSGVGGPRALTLALRADAALELASRASGSGSGWLTVVLLEGEGSRMVERREGAFLPNERRVEGRSDFAFGPARVPSKLVLRSGFAADDLAAVFNLLSAYGHGQEETGALVTLMDGGSLLVEDTPTPYWEHERRRHDESVPVLRRYSGSTADAPAPPAASVSEWMDGRGVTIAAIDWQDRGGARATEQRRVLFVKNRFLVVRDRFRFGGPMVASAGVVWHVGSVLGRMGDDFDAVLPAPLSNVWVIANPARHLWLSLVGRPGQRARAFVEPSYLPPPGCSRHPLEASVTAECRRGSPWVIATRWTGAAQTGDELWFDAVLVPTSQGLDGPKREDSVRVVRASGADLALEIRIGDERWSVCDRPGTAAGAPRACGADVETDAESVIARRDATGHYLLAHRVRTLDTRGLVRRWETPATIEEGLDRSRDRVAGP
ncbi:MAG: hypothetical protein R3E88_19940 [Myxococcota bacterium]